MRWIFWILAVIFYCYEYTLRVAPSVMVQDIMNAFSIDAGLFGGLIAFYLYAYAPMQLPAGLLMDRYGARKLLTFALLLCAVGSLLFGVTENLTLARLGRFLMGAGSAFAFVGLVYICSHWFSGKRMAFLVGFGNSLGMIGAVGGQGPLSFVVDSIGWRNTYLSLGLLGILLAILVLLIVRNQSNVKTEVKEVGSLSEVFTNFSQILKNRWTWVNSVIALLFYTTTVNFAGLWAVPFFQTAYGFNKALAGFAASTIYIGWIVGGPFIGHWSDRIGKRKPIILLFSLIALFAISAVIYIENLPVWLVFSLLLIGGIALSGQLLTYTLSVELNIAKAKGSAIAFTNFMVFLAGSIIQPLVGYLLDHHAHVIGTPGTNPFSVADYHFALMVFPLSLALTFLLTLFFKEKKHQDHRADFIL
ncbi:MAG: MFS transporter [Simkaniaceae bacterium]|nr:MFS transporter [Simkaniaceae bacterium]